MTLPTKKSYNLEFIIYLIVSLAKVGEIYN